MSNMYAAVYSAYLEALPAHLREASERPASTCRNPAHDHTTVVGVMLVTAPDGITSAEEVTYPGPVPMRCYGCGVPAHYDEGAGWYVHDAPGPGCSLGLPADDAGASPCQPGGASRVDTGR